jgi:hypothetical protein
MISESVIRCVVDICDYRYSKSTESVTLVVIYLGSRLWKIVGKHLRPDSESSESSRPSSWESA